MGSPLKRCRRAGKSVSFTRVLLPEPLTPVTTQSTPSGNVTSIALRLLPCAPLTVRFRAERAAAVGRAHTLAAGKIVGRG